MEERTFLDRHGVKVFSRWWPVASPRGVVLVSHGASEHVGRYERFALALNTAGFAAVGLDHRGHGRTGGSAAGALMGPGGGEAVLDDLGELHQAAIEEFGGDTPVVLFGHSLGAVIGLAYLTRHATELGAAILSGFPASLEDAASTGELLGQLAEAGMRDQPAGEILAAYNETFEPSRTGFDWLSRDPGEVDRYIGDPLCGDDNPLTYGYLQDIFGIVAPALDRLADISCPVYVIAGDRDPAGAMGAHPTALADSLKAAGVAADLVVYHDARHELLNETNRDEVTANLVRWLDSHI